MPLLDLSLVTQTVMDLVTTHVTASDAWSPANMLTVVALPPDRLTGDNALGFYLYHVVEETKSKSAYVPGVSDNPVRYTPMGLHLYYVLTAHSDGEDAGASLREQLMMGLAMKALHDNPVVSDDTTINGTQVMHPLLRGSDNAFRISMMPVKPEDAVQYWTAGSSPLRLAAYYQLSVIHLEPDEPSVRPGRVLTYNVYVLPSDTPRIDTTENIITFIIPTESDPRSLELRPAQVAYDQPFTVIGSAFTGDRVELQIRRADWSDPVAVDAVWNVSFTASRIFATVRDQVAGIDVIPGIYAISVRVERWRTTNTGTRILDSISNESPFAIAPEVTAVGVPNGAGQFAVTGRTFQHPDLAAGMIKVYVGAGQLAEGDPLNLQPGEFAVTSPTTLLVRLPGGFVSGDRPSLRILVNGAESAPLWVALP